MREIKFRLLDKIDKKIVDIKDTDSLYIKNNKVFNVYEYKEFGAIRINNVDVSCRYEIMQYTGLKDKNGKEIYEGDIVKYSHKAVGEIKRIVNYKYGMYGIEGIMEGTHIPFANILESEYEVIGNIYEDKHLLEEV